MSNLNLSKTKQRGFIYLMLITTITLIITFWNLPDNEIKPIPSDSTAESTATTKRQRAEQQYSKKSKKNGNKHTFNRQYKDSTSAEEIRSTWNDSMYRKNASRPVTKREVIVELNSADTLSLQMINGIGPAYARRIVRYRERLGGFTDKEQLMEIYGFTPELLNHIAPHITIDRENIRKIAINSVTIKELMRHPYIDAYQARDIIAYRDKGHKYRNSDDLLLIVSLNDSIIEHIQPYISFE
ncbi:MAG: helix-hairpin-helix domain-containing protein [Bacteroidales bacterium]|nr:helix-hairpin-helix domain-containing protein [Bacteroidales bacterium]